MFSSPLSGLQKLSSKPVTYFMLKLLVLLSIWMVFKYLTGPDETPIEDKNFPGIAPAWLSVQQILRYFLLWSNKIILLLMGYEGVYSDDYLIAVKGYAGVVVGDPCLAIELMALYAALVLATNAPLITKLLGVIAGMTGIQTINIVRITAVNLMTIYYPEYANIAHHYMFNTIVFIAILLMFNFFLHYSQKQANLDSQFAKAQNDS